LRDGAWRGSSGPIKNRDLWERLFGLVWDGKRDVRFVRIKGHAGDPNNERVDRLAREAALSGAVCAPDVEATLAFDGDPGSRPTVLDGFAATTGPPLDPARGAEAARKLKSLGVKGVLVKAAELGYITQVTCKMAECFCPEELGGARYFEPLAELGDWTPTHHYFPLSKRDGGRKTVDNALLAHRLCNRIDYSISVGQSYEKDLAKVRRAREAAAGS